MQWVIMTFSLYKLLLPCNEDIMLAVGVNIDNANRKWTLQSIRHIETTTNAVERNDKTFFVPNIMKKTFVYSTQSSDKQGNIEGIKEILFVCI